MTGDDRRFLSSFEAGTLSSFHHRDHVRLAWIYLRREGLLDALERFSVGLRRFAVSKGKPNLYHETITWALLFVIKERIVRGAESGFAAFEKRNPDLFEWPSGLLENYYKKETLASDLARKTFLLPDRVGQQVPSQHGLQIRHRTR